MQIMMKYIRHKEFGFVLFESGMAHDAIGRLLGRPEAIVSAGFVLIPDAAPRCLGHSGTLGIGAGPTDTEDLHDRASLTG
ncbi:MAG TPA: hypothetical protein VHE61_04490 [Opitutaceae bacterium]|nr:hypothetical protein [Opitutaceae bacterium]